MKRRNVLIGLGLLPLTSTAKADGTGWRARLVSGGFDGNDYWAGLHIALGEGWKTYWRVPGEAGIPPEIKVEGVDVTGFEVLFPLPERIDDESGEAIGYHHEVLLPIRISVKDAGKVPDAALSAFFGVCKEICAPAKFESKLSDAKADAELLKAWRAKVPAAGTFASGVTQEKDEVVLTFTGPADDILAEGPVGLYFRRPVISGSTARFKIDGLDEGQKLSGESLTFTATNKGQGLVQVITVA
ncbi:protein-disulfide reductase DsbD domain-containing protein [Aestuariivirga litoralis]|uniref:protein-disulfide reductase DsbD domain-containing protein n=1 Tax=Aestuariivirga litoralis TaxID=2650924 RepID=UPI0018C6DDF0|nr:protein-disulfide reductase DsbD domain-containing protein [Aestuariivirga litoralis]MBG1233384.1 hypothetical protein [Aestuariivirga litoralis]